MRMKEENDILYPTNAGYMTLYKLLPEIHGREMDDVTWAFLSTLRPSCVVVLGYDEPQMGDSYPWRVRVYLDRDKKIVDVTQEVRVALLGDMQNGWDVRMRLQGKTFNETFPDAEKDGGIGIVNTRAIERLNK